MVGRHPILDAGLFFRLFFSFLCSVARRILLFIPLVALLIEGIRYAFREGDFAGYAIAGEYALKGMDLYSHWLNTWPPLFSVFCIPIYWLNEWAPLPLRLLWQLLSIAAFFHLANRLMLLFKKQKLVFRKSKHSGELSVDSWYFVLPFLFTFKYVLDNLANLQINIIMLALVIEAVYLFKRKQNTVWSAFLLALTLSLKVYTLFFFMLFFFIREWKFVLLTLSWMVILHIPMFAVMGWNQSFVYFERWWVEIAQAFPMIGHKNQSFFAAVWRLTVNEDAGLGISTNLLSMSIEQSKRLVYVLVLIIGAFPLWRIIQNPKMNFNLLFTLFVASIPLLSPLAWKAYFIFLTPAIFYISSLWLDGLLKRRDKVMFVMASVFLILSSDIFIGPYASDLAELFSLITLGAVLIISILALNIIEKSNFDKPDEESIGNRQ